MHVKIQFSEKQQLVIWNLHDYRWEAAASSLARDVLMEQIELAHKDPLQYIVMIQGDFNRQREGES
eukprot:9668935-Karenia_brevis.AAC.1